MTPQHAVLTFSGRTYANEAEAQADLLRLIEAVTSPPVEKELLDAMKVKLAIGRYEDAARAVIRSARRASSGQDLVLRDALSELADIIGEPFHTA